MRILHVGSPFADFMGNFGLIFRCSEELQKMGHEVDIVTTDADCFYFDKEKSRMYASTRQKLFNTMDKPIIINGVRVYALHCITPRFGMYCPDATKFAKKIIKNYDVIHICNWYSYISIIFYKIACENNIPFFVSPWGSLLPEARKLKKNQKLIVDMLYTKKMVLQAAGFQSAGDSETQELIKLGANPKKIYRIDNPVDLRDFEIKEQSGILDRIGINERTDRYLLFLSRINKKKGIELLLQAFVKVIEVHKDLSLVIAGSGEPYYEKEIKQMVHELGIEESVKFTGLVSNNEKLELLESAKLFVLTSHSDVHPIAVQDALTMGVPVVITKKCDYPEVEEYDAGIIVEPDVESIHKAINKILYDENRLNIFSKNAKRLINERFLLKDQAKKYEQMYLNVAKEKVMQ